MTWGTITDEGLAEAAALIGQPLRRSRMQWIETATRDAIRHFAWGVGDNNPLLTPSPVGTGPEGKARLEMLERTSLGSWHIADPDGVLLDIVA